jgi:hypothetical protein
MLASSSAASRAIAAAIRYSFEQGASVPFGASRTGVMPAFSNEDVVQSRNIAGAMSET